MAEFDKERLQFLLKRKARYESDRQQFMHHWDDLSRVLLPRRQGFTSTVVEGDDRLEDIYDGTGMQSARSLATTVGAMIFSEGEVFANIRLENDKLESTEEGGEWLADSTERFDKAIRNPKARFRQSSGEVNLDLVVLGTGFLFNGLSLNREHLLFKSMNLKDGLAIFNDEGHPVGMMRSKKLPVWELAHMFGKENLSEKTQELMDAGKHDEIIEIMGVIMERTTVGASNPIFAKNLPFTDLWFETKALHVMHNGGYHEFPYIIPRWDTSSGESYGRSPGMIALPDVNTSQAMQETMLIAGQRVADPPLMAPNDGTFSEVNTFPGALTYYDVQTAQAIGGNPFFPLISGANLPLTRDMQSDTRNQIMAAFFKNILNLPVDGPQMTATEIIQRKDEFIREVGSVFGTLESDYNQRIAERSFNIMLREGGFAPIPEILAGQNVKFEFELPVTKIRKQVVAAAARQWALETYEMSPFDPRLKHIVNGEGLSRFTHEANGLPHTIINSAEDVEDAVQQELAQIQEQQEAAAMQQELEMAKTGAGAIKDLGAVQLDDQTEAQPA